ncbi:hypothetical protein A3I99_01585 [Candidatus Kaiserbacteria bacterium RIFCSPLOWO2_02_FULL_45_11b]|uniref:Uncharacterized protein n=1 Tax=Candidatus Kaiserbacteria bacterium RIFCSPLOWO2_12_FULL_45_26 TaxID=1798525 RepID=A0A1F6FFZ0_9BACT|nr:MAG: hypothetical protein A2Z56_03925 [Candidatus Kaiserbacteria bacterium RIFCSPHIGHO2_12_45_16]OGG70522.1 MAG: hypothetical protein A2929_04830 [Candidatus Kaiserbacteria bacterium RIFCSPLOWO2_01_FULL_45_25]OGG81007.1 MAG: hypothetical protein A3I99_01585 [Candidatus Kaiserbacteria bacterium RIFCSPLOWO2_02_FULL_45_11b]OGG84750.1 MAG: hypothetical protein A3G90_01535 [Candidatus Kaiserbacteria bacterium RIFCSPLOWO2_12_FULL_45_26]
MNNNVLVAVIVVILIVIGFFIYGAMNDETDTVPTTATSSNSSTGSTSAEIEAEFARNATIRAEEAKAKEVAFTIDVTKLPEAQQASLKVMGMNDTSIDITNAMLTCARVDMSETRVKEIEDGASVTASEGIKLVSCYNAN